MNGKTIEDVAQIVGCSVGTVSRAINNRKGVSEKTRKRILKTMEEIGYQPNAVAQSLTLKQTHSIGVIIPDISHDFLGGVALAIEDELSRHHYDMLLFNTKWDPQMERKKLLLAQAKRVDGIILKPAVDDIPFMKPIHTPTVLVSQTYTGNTSFVDIENETAGYLATSHLLDCGYRRIAFLGGNPVTGMVRQRLDGYLHALAERGIPVDPRLICHCDYTISDGSRHMDALLALPEPPDAVFCCSDASALGACKSADEHGYHIPEQIGIVGFNDDEIAGIPQVSLTTIGQPRRQIGQLAAQMIINMIENKEDWHPQKVLLSPELIVRSTTRKIAAP